MGHLQMGPSSLFLLFESDLSEPFDLLLEGLSIEGLRLSLVLAVLELLSRCVGLRGPEEAPLEHAHWGLGALLVEVRE